MVTLLHVFAHPTPETSLTMRIANAFVESYRQAHSGDAVEIFDLYSDQVNYRTGYYIWKAEYNVMYHYK